MPVVVVKGILTATQTTSYFVKPVRLNGKFPKSGGRTVFLQYLQQGKWVSVRKAVADPNGRFSFVWKTGLEPQTLSLRARTVRRASRHQKPAVVWQTPEVRVDIVGQSDFQILVDDGQGWQIDFMSDDGSTIFASPSGAGDDLHYRINTTSGETSELVDPSGVPIYPIDSSDDGNDVLYYYPPLATWGRDKLYLLDSTAGSKAFIAEVGDSYQGATRKGLGEASISDDGNTVAFRSDDPALLKSGDTFMTHETGFFVWNGVTKATTLVAGPARDIEGPRLSGDGNNILYTTLIQGANSSISQPMLMNLMSGAIRQIGDLRNVRGDGRQKGGLGISDDGSTILLGSEADPASGQVNEDRPYGDPFTCLYVWTRESDSFRTLDCEADENGYYTHRIDTAFLAGGGKWVLDTPQSMVNVETGETRSLIGFGRLVLDSGSISDDGSIVGMMAARGKGYVGGDPLAVVSWQAH